MMNGRQTHRVNGCWFSILQVSFVLILTVCVPCVRSASVTGLVRDANGPISGAIVRVKATSQATTTGPEGRFVLDGLTPDQPVVLCAWARGYYIGGGDAAYMPGASNIEMLLTRHSSQDNPDYMWLSAFAQAGYSGSGEDNNCEHCHAHPDDAQASLPFNEWRGDAHAQAALNPRFLTMYSGTDTAGHQSPLTAYFHSRDYGRIPLRPDPNKPYFGPGYRLDFPETQGNCSACHTPAAAIDAPFETDPTTVTGVGIEGVTCDVCHKVWDVRLDPASNRPYANRPGVLSFEFRRPPPGHQFFAGPLDDVAPGENTFTPVQRQSRYCAPCHVGVFWDTLIYNSFGEWLESPYSNPVTGKTCQDCHMPAGLTDHFARPDAGGLMRDPQTIASHRMPGAADIELLQNAVAMDVTVERQDHQLSVTVAVTNDRTGHHVPTDSPLRHLILLIETRDAQGDLLPQADGPVLPAWCGIGDPNQSCYGGLPGKAFAKVLEELWTNVSPTGAYWNPTRVLSDNRIAALATDTSHYVFTDPSDGKVTVNVTLIFRRAFITLALQKNWNGRDIVMENTTLTVLP